jgi:hypothetical protein
MGRYSRRMSHSAKAKPSDRSTPIAAHAMVTPRERSQSGAERAGQYATWPTARRSCP